MTTAVAARASTKKPKFLRRVRFAGLVVLPLLSALTLPFCSRPWSCAGSWLPPSSGLCSDACDGCQFTSDEMIGALRDVSKAYHCAKFEEHVNQSLDEVSGRRRCDKWKAGIGL